MIDTSKMAKPEFDPVTGEMREVCETLHRAADIIATADRVPDEAVKNPLLTGAETMLQNVIDALNGRRTDGLVQSAEEDD